MRQGTIYSAMLFAALSFAMDAPRSHITPHATHATFASAARTVAGDASGSLIVAHRSNGCGGVENTLDAIERCIAQGVRAIEVDVRYTADRVPVLFHDAGLLRMTLRRGDLRSFTAEQLREVRLPYGERIPTLEDALLRYGSHAMFDLDMKEDDYGPLVEVLSRTDAFASVYVRAYKQVHYAQMPALTRAHPRLQVMPSLLRDGDLDLAHAYEFPFRIVEVRQDAAPALIARVRSQGLVVQSRIRTPYVFQCEQYLEMRSKGISIIQTDSPVRILACDDISLPTQARAGLLQAVQVSSIPLPNL